MQTSFADFKIRKYLKHTTTKLKFNTYFLLFVESDTICSQAWSIHFESISMLAKVIFILLTNVLTSSTYFKTFDSSVIDLTTPRRIWGSFVGKDMSRLCGSYRNNQCLRCSVTLRLTHRDHFPFICLSLWQVTPPSSAGDSAFFSRWHKCSLEHSCLVACLNKFVC